MKRLLACIAVAAVFAGEAMAAMPTQKELAEVKSIVFELMRPLVKGYKARTITAAEVGDGAVGFAAKAETVAAKYRLLTGAVEYYAADREYDKAADVIEAICELVPDIPPEEFRKMVSAAARGATDENGARLIKLEKMARLRVQVDKRLKVVEKALRHKSADAGLMKSRAELTAATGDWNAALAKFAKLAGETGRIAKGEKSGTIETMELAGFWWDYKAAEPLAADAIAMHAVALYRKAVDAGELSGLHKVLAEKRIASAEASNLVALPERRTPSPVYKFEYKLDKKGGAVLTYTYAKNKTGPCVAPKPEGVLVVPDEIDGHKVTGFSEWAFWHCDKMTRIVLPKHLATFGLHALHGCRSLERIDISKENEKYVSIDGVLYSKNRKILWAYPKTREKLELVPECDTIGPAACSHCQFREVRLPPGITQVAVGAFGWCKSLESIDFPKGFRHFGGLRMMGIRCFWDCPKLQTVRFHGDAPSAPSANNENCMTGSPKDTIVEVERGTKGWDGKGGDALPETWPLEGFDARKIRYIK